VFLRSLVLAPGFKAFGERSILAHISISWIGSGSATAGVPIRRKVVRARVLSVPGRWSRRKGEEMTSESELIPSY